MKNFIQDGKKMTHTALAAVASGGVVVLASGIAVAMNKLEIGEIGEIMTEGVFELPKAAPLVITQGDRLYWDAGAGKLTKTAAGNTPAGIAHEGAIEAATVARVKLDLAEVAQAAVIAAHGAPAPVATVLTDLATAGGNTYTDAAVNAIFDEVQTALDAKADSADLITVAAKLDAVIAALKAAGLMANA